MSLYRYLLLLSCTIIMLGSHRVGAEDAPSDALKSFLAAQQQPLPLHVNFVQRRSIEGLPRPLVSEGELTITATQVLWHTQQPLQQQLTISAEGITAGGDGTTMRGSEVVAQLLLAVLQGDAEALAQNFSYQQAEHCLALQPKAAQLQQFIREITSCGSAGIEQVTIEETQGNRSVITFTPRESQADATH